MRFVFAFALAACVREEKKGDSGEVVDEADSATDDTDDTGDTDDSDDTDDADDIDDIDDIDLPPCDLVDPRPVATFDDVTAAHHTPFLDVMGLTIALVAVEEEGDPDCPIVTTAEDGAVTYAGPCTTSLGGEYDGSMTVWRSPEDEPYQYTMTLDAFRVTDGRTIPTFEGDGAWTEWENAEGWHSFEWDIHFLTYGLFYEADNDVTWRNTDGEYTYRGRLDNESAFEFTDYVHVIASDDYVLGDFCRTIELQWRDDCVGYGPGFDAVQGAGTGIIRYPDDCTGCGDLEIDGASVSEYCWP